MRKGRPRSLPLEDRVLLIAAYWRTNLTLRQPAPLFGVSKPAADRTIDKPAPSLALQQHKRFRENTVLIVDGTLPTRDHQVAEQSKHYRYSTNHQVVLDADTRLVVPSRAGLHRRVVDGAIGRMADEARGYVHRYRLVSSGTKSSMKRCSFL